MSDTLKILVIIILILLATVTGTMFIKKRGGTGGAGQTTGEANLSYPKILGAKGEPSTVTLPLGPGSRLNITIKTYMDIYQANETPGQNQTELNTSADLDITGYEWPFIKADVTVRGNTSNNQSLPLFILEMPAEVLGKKSFNAAISIPMVREGFCVNLTLTKSSGEYYIYESTFSIGNYEVHVEMNVTREGIVRESLYRVKTLEPVNGQHLIMTNIMIINNYEIKNESFTVQVPGNWSCNPPLSSHLWFTWEGIYVLKDCSIKPANVGMLQDAMNNGSFVIFLNKGCPHCIKTWPNITVALSNICSSLERPVYLVVMGGFLNQTLSSYLQNTMIQNGLTGYPAFAYFEGGFLRDKMMGERPVDEIIVFFERNSGQGGG